MLDTEGEKRKAEDFWRNSYAQAFMDMDPGRYADQFTFPCMIRAENIPRTAFADRAQLVAHVTEMIDRAKATDWVRSTIDRFDIRLLDADVATVSVDASRFDESDRLIDRLYGEYTLNKTREGWRMAAIFGGFYPRA